MAGTNPNFSATEFREAITFAMTMGLPENEQERATFRWTSTKTFTNAVDPTGSPYDFDEVPATTTTHDDVRIPVAVEFFALRTASEGGTPLGSFNTPKAVLTVLDTDYPSIEGADQVLLGGNTYTIDFVAPPLGLFDATIYQIYCTALDEA